MKINWIIDKYLFDEYESKLVDAITASGANMCFYDEMRCCSFQDWVTKCFKQDEIVIFHGSLQHGRQISHLPLYPGVFFTNIDNYECYKYYGYYGNNLLNNKYLMMGLNDVVRQKSNIMQMIPSYGFADRGQEYKIFIRPSNGYKTFAGQLISVNNIEKEIQSIKNSYGGVDPDTLVLLSSVQNIKEEYRFVIVNGKVITGSLYMDELNRKDLKPYYDRPICDGEAFTFATKMASIYQPDKAFTIDVCKTDNGVYKLLEINSFNCASMYGADYGKVVEAVNKLAIDEYNEIFN